MSRNKVMAINYRLSKPPKKGKKGRAQEEEEEAGNINVDIQRLVTERLTCSRLCGISGKLKKIRLVFLCNDLIGCLSTSILDCNST